MRAAVAPAMAGDATVAASQARALRWVGRFLWGYTLLFIYGCLVPLQFSGLTLAEAWQAFQRLPPPGQGPLSRGDIAVNVLIMMPLAFLAAQWLGLRRPPARSRRQGWVRGAAVAMLVTGAAMSLSFAVEFAQLFVVSRTASLTDIASQAVGVLLGLALQAWRGQRFHAWLLGLFRPQAGLGDRLASAAAAYVLLVVAYHLMPLDISPYPVDLYRKWRDGFIVLVPFGFGWPSRGAMLHTAMLDVLVWVPLGWWWAYRLGQGAAAVGRVLLLALAIELMQLPIQSRVVDVTDLLWALLGGAAGAWAARKDWRLVGAILSPNPARWGTFAALWLLWLLIALYQAWFPFDLDWGGWNRAALREAWAHVPFSGKYIQSPLSALGDMLGKLGLFLCGGLLLGLGLAVPGYPAQVAQRRAAWVLLLICALVSEGGQLLLGSRQADLADVLLKALGAWLGLRLGAWLAAAAAARGTALASP
jgi:VanZ family protein